MDFDTDFKKNLIKNFNDKNLSQTSINFYVRNLERLNDDKPLKNLNFLKNTNEILEKLSKYKENTKRGYLISIVTSLALDKTKKKLYDVYYDLLMKKNKELKEFEKSGQKTETMEKNWESLENIKNKQKELSEKVAKFSKNKNITEQEYNTLLEYLILSLYTLIPPRRNEYNKMNIIYKYSDKFDDNFNYLSYSDNKFIFNVYKTAKKEGQKIMDIPEDLKNVIDVYIKFHPLLKSKVLKTTDVPFLVYYNGEEFNKTNSITRILNKIFGKRLGSSMIRHIMLSDKYKDVIQEMKQDAEAMGHSVSMQKDYIKK